MWTSDRASSGDAPWYGDAGVLTRRPADFYPLGARHTPAERLNAFVRLVFYVCLALWAWTGKHAYALGGLLAVLATSCAAAVAGGPMLSRGGASAFRASDNAKLRGGGAKRCTRTTRDNPFGNMLPYDRMDRPAACPFTPEVTTNFMRGVPRDAYDDLYNDGGANRFHTMPVTTATSDLGAFRRFAFEGAGRATCKEDTRMCSRMTG